MDQSVSMTLDYDELDDADNTLKTLLVGLLHQTAPDDVTDWNDVPGCIQAQYNSTLGFIYAWGQSSVASVPDPENPPKVHVNWGCRVPDGLIPWGDGGGTNFPMGASVQCDWIDPSVLIDVNAPTP